MNTLPPTNIAKRFQKIVAAFLIAAMNWQGLWAVISTDAAFGDSETSSNNAFAAGILGMTKTESDWSASSLNPGETATRTVTISKAAGSLDFDYNVTVSAVSGDLCPYLNLAAALNNEQVYNGLAEDLAVPVNPYSGGEDIWDFAATLASNEPALSGKSCNFEILYQALQGGGGGFSDSKTVSNTIGAGSSWEGSFVWTGNEQLNFSGSSSEILRPNASGSQTELASSGGANYRAVNGATPDEATYVFINETAEKRDLYNLSDTTRTGVINWVKAHAVMKQTGESLSAGPNNAGNGVNVAGIGSVSWRNPGNIKVAGSPYSEIDIPAGNDSNYLVASNYNFSIPEHSVIKGIQVDIMRRGERFDFIASRGVVDKAIYLVKAGSIQTSGNNKANTSTRWPDDTFGKASYGGQNDLWNIGWSRNEINDSGFGVAVAAHNNASLIQFWAKVDYANITVFYTIPGTGKTYIQTSAGSFAGNSNALTSSYVDYATQYDTYPGTTDKWTWDQLNSLQAGIGLQGSSRTTQVWAEVNYGIYATERIHESAVYDSNGITRWNTLAWTGDISPAGTKIELSARVSNDESNWTAWTSWSTNTDIALASLPESRFIQWRARLSTASVAHTPSLTGVTVSYRASLAGSSIKLNEFLPEPSSGNEWVELYNKGTAAVDLNGWQIKTADGSASATIGTGAVLQPNDWYVAYLSGNALGNISGGIELYDPLGNKVDFYNYDLCDSGAITKTPDSTNGIELPGAGTCESGIPTDKSYARIPDGTGPWYDPIPTPGATNELSNEEIGALNATTTEEIIASETMEQQLEEFFEEIEAAEQETGGAADAPAIDSSADSFTPEIEAANNNPDSSDTNSESAAADNTGNDADQAGESNAEIKEASEPAEMAANENPEQNSQEPADSESQTKATETEIDQADGEGEEIVDDEAQTGENASDDAGGEPAGQISFEENSDAVFAGIADENTDSEETSDQNLPAENEEPVKLPQEDDSSADESNDDGVSPDTDAPATEPDSGDGAEEVAE